jgi:hypothetical protein
VALRRKSRGFRAPQRGRGGERRGPDGGLDGCRAEWRPCTAGRRAGRELLLNVVLPFASLDAALEEQAVRLVQALPAAPSYGKTAFLEANLAGRDGGLRARSALEQQGLLAMVTDWCRQGGCGRCPLS